MPEFRAAGLLWAQYASIATGVLLLLFMSVPGLSNQYTVGAAGIRGAMVLALVLVCVLLRGHPRFSTRNYVWIVGGASGFMLTGLAALMVTPGFGAVSTNFSPIPAMFLGLF